MRPQKRKNWPFPHPMGDLENLFDQNRFFDSEWMDSQKLPAVNVKEEEDKYEIEVAAPGLLKEDLNVKVENGILTVSSEQKKEEEKKEDNYTRKEFSYTSFSRSFTLPENVDEENIKAKYENGVLLISVGKTNKTIEQNSKQIQVG